MLRRPCVVSCDGRMQYFPFIFYERLPVPSWPRHGEDIFRKNVFLEAPGTFAFGTFNCTVCSVISARCTASSLVPKNYYCWKLVRDREIHHINCSIVPYEKQTKKTINILSGSVGIYWIMIYISDLTINQKMHLSPYTQLNSTNQTIRPPSQSRTFFLFESRISAACVYRTS